MMPIPYILVLILISHANTQCLANLYTTNLTTDLLQLSHNSDGTIVYNYTFKTSFQNVPKVALAVTQLSVKGQSALLNPFFYIWSQNISKGAIQIYTYSQNSKWTITKVNLIAGHNSQLLVGSTALQNSKSTSGSTNTRLSFQISINTTLPVNNNQISRGFINGFSCTGQFATLSLVNTTLNKDSISFSFDATAGGVQIIWVSFVVFNLNNGEFSAYGGFTVINNNVSDRIDLLKGFSATQNAFYGINTLQSTPQSNTLGLQVDIDANFIMKYSSSSGKFVVAYLFIGYASNFTCFNCRGNSMNYHLNGVCVSQCTGNTIPVNLVNGGQMCRDCPLGTGMIAVNGACACPSNSQFVNNRCVQSLEGLNVQLGQNLAIRPTSVNSVSSSSSSLAANNGVINIVPSSTVIQQVDFASQGTSTTVSPQAGVAPSKSLSSSSQGTITSLPTSTATSRSASSSTPTSFSTSSSSSSSATASSTSSSFTSSSPSSSGASSFLLPPFNNPAMPVDGTSGGQTTPQLFGITATSSNCPIPNSYFNGNQCVCRVSYVYHNGICMLPQIPAFTVPSINVPPGSNSTIIIGKCQQNAYYNGTLCVCLPNYYLINSVCTKCQANSQWNGLACICNQNYYSLNGECVLKKSNCPENSVDNGLGTCICMIGYTMVNSQCISASNVCPPNSTFVNNACVCNKGLFNVSGACSQCPSGAFWSSQSKVCVYVCGVNSFYNSSIGNCTCIPGFGVGSSGSCQQCTNNYYLSNGYCVTCPINSIFNQNAKGCLCISGFSLSQQGVCLPKCRQNQVYNQITTGCDCITNYTRTGTTCIPCDSNSYYVNSQCFNCPPNSLANNGQCVCVAGYIANSAGICVECLSQANTFIMNNFCATCPNNQIYSSNTGRCECPIGKTLSGNLCIQSCNNDELLDSKGNCYSCSMNQVISNEACVCRPGYVSNGCGGCDLSCAKGYFSFMGQCAICPMNMNYFQQIVGCICPNGYYMNPITNVCQKSPFATSCSNGLFYDSVRQDCTQCPSSCKSCLSLKDCTSCQNGFNLVNGICQAICGDGLIRGGQNCDKGSFIQDGCVNCKIATGYSCNSEPSRCFITTPTPTPTPTPNPAAPLALKGNISLNSNNVYLTLQTNPTFTFPDPTVMQSFIRATFYNGIRPSTYCMQQAKNLNLFDCLLIYPSGIPNNKFRVLFSYNYKGYIGNTTITIDPLLILSTRKL